MFTVGPDWKFSIIELILVNLLVGLSIKYSHGIMTLVTIGVLTVQNLTFLLTVTSNPGMLRRDPTLHSLEYLRYLAAKNK